MRQPSARVVAAVATVAVAAVGAGGLIATRQGPEDGAAGGPLSGAPTSATPSRTPSPSVPSSPSAIPSTPSPPPSPSKPAYRGPAKVALTLAKLSRGRAPEVTYVSGRVVQGGGGEPMTVPGTGKILSAARHNGTVLVVASKGAGTELLKLTGSSRPPVRVPDVRSLVTSPDGRRAAYATERVSSTGASLKGSTISFEGTEGTTRKLERPGDLQLRVMAVVQNTVYFESGESETDPSWDLYAWDTTKSSATAVRAVRAPSGLNNDASVASSVESLGEERTCSNVISVASGERLWRTCDYEVIDFTPDRTVAIAAPSSRDGYADGLAAALDATAGKLLRQWKGPFFRGTVAEDDDHLLMLADDGPETKAAIIRCTISTGACELATPIGAKDLVLG